MDKLSNCLWFSVLIGRIWLRRYFGGTNTRDPAELPVARKGVSSTLSQQST